MTTAFPYLTDRIKCPCDRFTAMSKIEHILHSSDDNDDDEQGPPMTCLLDWLNGATDDKALHECKLLSCGKRSRCRFRYGTSFAILNAIRDACQSHLDKSNNFIGSNGGSRRETEGSSNVLLEEVFVALPQQQKQPYEQAFPALINPQTPAPTPSSAATANILVPSKKPSTTTKVASLEDEKDSRLRKKNSKRRIRPALVTQQTADEPNNFWKSQQQQQSSSLSSASWTGTHHSAFLEPRGGGGDATTTTNPAPFGVWGTRTSHTSARITVERSLEPVKKALDFSTLQEKLPDRALSDDHVLNPTIATTTTATVTTELPATSHNNLLHAVVKHDGADRGSTSHALENLISLYIALFRNMLVPSAPLELHFLFRLMVVDEGSIASSGDQEVSFFQSILATGRDCQRFAVLALTKLKHLLIGLPIQVLQKIVLCEPFRLNCGELVYELNAQLDRYKQHGLPMIYPTEAVTGSHAILSLPFDEERDSRHNYKTPAEIAVYKNREESRDAFLLELRTFMGSKGKVFRPQDMEQSQDRVRRRARDIMSGLLTVNMMWFAQFYCDILLQVGLSPVQETDQELLNITDQDKLQKLHKRFSSRSAHTSKSSKKISITKRPTSSSRLPLEEAHQLFTGYQEFFFLFLHDLAFNFGFHLRGRMTKVVLNLLSDISANDLEKKVTKLQLISRFLGYLVFSPNWHEAEIDQSKIQSLAVSNGLVQLESLGLSLASHVKNAWATGRLIAVIPCVTELLKMAKWDSCTQASGNFRLLLADLRQIQKALSCPDETTNRFQASMEIVVFCLERFFDNTCGLPRLTSLPMSQTGPVTYDSRDCLDGEKTGFSTVFLFASSPHIEDLLCLVDHFGIGLANKSPSKARKLRPSVVSRSVDVEPSKLLSHDENGLLPTPVKGQPPKCKDILGTDVKRSIESRLVEGFFHQHRDLKEVCEFAVSQVMREHPTRIVSDCLRAVLESQEDGWAERGIGAYHANIISSTYEKAAQVLEASLEEKIGKALSLFGPCEIHPTVIMIATRVSVSSAMLAVQATLHSTIAHKLQEVQETPRRPNATLKVEETRVIVAVAALDRVAGLFSATDGRSSPTFPGVVDEMYKACSSILELSRGLDISIPPESTIRAIVSALLRLDKIGPKIHQWCQYLSEECFLEAFMSMTRLILAVSTISSYGLPAWVLSFDSQVVSRALEARGEIQGPVLLELFQELIEQNLIDSEVVVGNEKVPLHTYISRMMS